VVAEFREVAARYRTGVSNLGSFPLVVLTARRSPYAEGPTPPARPRSADHPGLGCDVGQH